MQLSKAYTPGRSTECPSYNSATQSKCFRDQVNENVMNNLFAGAPPACASPADADCPTLPNANTQNGPNACNVGNDRHVEPWTRRDRPAVAGRVFNSAPLLYNANTPNTGSAFMDVNSIRGRKSEGISGTQDADVTAFAAYMPANESVMNTVRNMGNYVGNPFPVNTRSSFREDVTRL